MLISLEPLTDMYSISRLSLWIVKLDELNLSHYEATF